MVEIGPPLVGLPVVVLGRPDDHVRETVRVDVPGPAHGAPEQRRGLIALRGPSRGGLQRGIGAEIQVDPPFVRLAGIVIRRPDDHDPRSRRRSTSPGPRDRVAEVGGGLVRSRRTSLRRPPARRRSRETRRPGPRRSGRRRSRVRPDDQVIVAVSVDVPGDGHAVAETSAGLVALGRPRARHESVGRALVQEDLPAVAHRSVVAGRPDQELGKPVPVHVAGEAHGGAEVGAGLLALDAPGHDPRPGPVDQKHLALVGLAPVVVGRADDEVGQSVAVDVARGADRGAELRPRLVGLQRSSGPIMNPPTRRTGSRRSPRPPGRRRRAGPPISASEVPSPLTSPTHGHRGPPQRQSAWPPRMPSGRYVSSPEAEPV